MTRVSITPVKIVHFVTKFLYFRSVTRRQTFITSILFVTNFRNHVCELIIQCFDSCVKVQSNRRNCYKSVSNFQDYISRSENRISSRLYRSQLQCTVACSLSLVRSLARCSLRILISRKGTRGTVCNDESEMKRNSRHPFATRYANPKTLRTLRRGELVRRVSQRFRFLNELKESETRRCSPLFNFSFILPNVVENCREKITSDAVHSNRNSNNEFVRLSMGIWTKNRKLLYFSKRFYLWEILKVIRFSSALLSLKSIEGYYIF